MTMDTYGHLFPRNDDGSELAAAASADGSLQEKLMRRAVHIAASIKHPSFAEEREVQLAFELHQLSDMIQFRSSPQSSIPFVKVDVDGRRIGIEKGQKYANRLGMMEVIVWPENVDSQILDAIDMLYLGTTGGSALVNRSVSPYTT